MDKFNRNDNNIYEEYTREIKKYPLLTEDEEKKCANNIRYIECNIMKIKKVYNIDIKSIDLNKLFYSLNSENYKYVLDKLLNYYKSKNGIEDRYIYKCLYAYKKMSDKNNRVLEYEELKNLIKLDYNIDLKRINNLDEEVDKFILYKESYDKLFLSNLRLVVYFANKYCRNYEMIMDLISEGNIGLMRAIADYDPELNIKFSTYAAIWIKQKVRKYYAENDSIIRLPYNMKIKFMRYDKIIGNQKDQMTRDEIKKCLKINESEMKEYEKYRYEVLSLNQPIGDDEDETYENFLADTLNLEDVCMNDILKSDMKCLFENLNEQEKKVITLRFGLDGSNFKGGFTLLEIAKIMNLSSERIRIIELKAINKMRFMADKKKNCKSLINYIRS